LDPAKTRGILNMFREVHLAEVQYLLVHTNVLRHWVLILGVQLETLPVFAQL